ncbi:MAG: hypothetical protein R3A45_10320 [Bdellovibrionota bacterium]
MDIGGSTILAHQIRTCAKSKMKSLLLPASNGNRWKLRLPILPLNWIH